MKLSTTLIGLLLSSVIGNAYAEAPDWTGYMTKGWNGQRANLYEKGFQLEATHISDLLRNFQGGVKKKNAWLGHNDIALSFDFEKMLGFTGTSGYINYHQQFGTKFNAEYLGTFNGVSNIETGVTTHQLYEAWLEQNFADTISIRAGVYAVDSEFYVTETSGVFIQPPYGMSNELGQTGAAVYLTGALGIRVKYTADSGLYAQAAITDGVPGDPGNPYRTQITLAKGDGSFRIAELGFTGDNNYKAAVGTWGYTKKYADLVNGKAKSNYGVYGLIEGKLAPEMNNPDQGVSGFFRLGAANQDVNAADWTSSIGLAYQGLYSGRDNDVAALALTANHAGDHYSKSVGSDASTEYAYEMSYQAQIAPWASVKPTLQYIVNPGMSDSARNILVGGVRGEVSF